MLDSCWREERATETQRRRWSTGVVRGHELAGRAGSCAKVVSTGGTPVSQLAPFVTQPSRPCWRCPTCNGSRLLLLSSVFRIAARQAWHASVPLCLCVSVAPLFVGDAEELSTSQMLPAIAGTSLAPS